MRTLIDGYNLMHAAGLIRGKLVGKQLEGARERLVKRVAFHMTKDERAHTIVIFDAKVAPAMASREAFIEGIRVLYPEPGHEADELIEELIRQDMTPRKLRIVSSDRRLHRAARERLAVAVASDRFLDELDERRVRRERDDSTTARVAAGPVRPSASLPVTPPESPVSPSPRAGRRSPDIHEVDYWLKEFGTVEIPSEEELDDSPALSPRGPIVLRSDPAAEPPVEPRPSAPREAAIQPLAKPAGGARWTPRFQESAAPVSAAGTPPRGRQPSDPSPGKPTDEDQQARELAFWQAEVARVLQEEARSKHP